MVAAAGIGVGFEGLAHHRRTVGGKGRRALVPTDAAVRSPESYPTDRAAFPAGAGLT